jgi:hypothetical protein
MLPSKLVAKTNGKALISATRKTNIVNQPRAHEGGWKLTLNPETRELTIT